ncbi:MAG: hypothetical protein BGP10_01190 [Rhodanobacter sp. 68-29]|nr:hypothetical protein [Rhodanobacter sp.]ODU75211.1 MAG: hypothetical protein ABT17_04540 [Rhodanobacter sp. SCN 69-32]OJY59584.1 MAG: hypothetical protein BGP10_01190 [Rhodanobacter sp. 68-29]
MKKFFFAVVLAVLPIIAIAADKSPNGVYRPSLSTNARSYLRDFPLNKVPADEIVQYVGAPDKSYSLSGKDYITYDIEPKGGKGIIEYTFVVKDGLVVEVTYLNSGNFFGVTQRESALALQKK